MATPTPASPKALRRDVPGALLVVLCWLWIHLTTLAAYAGAWFIEQFLVALGVDWPRWAWLLISLAHVTLLLVPLLPLALLWRRPRYRALFRAWAAAALYAACLIPARLARANQEHLAAGLSILGSTAYLAARALVLWRQGRLQRPPARRAIAPALLLSILLAYPWVIWGALGSALDMALDLLSALLFGGAAALVVDQALRDPLAMPTAPAGWRTLVRGAVTSTALLIMGAALGFNGGQLLLMLVVPALGWLLPSFDGLREGRPEAVGRLRIALLLAAAAAAPMLFVDPDELALALNLATRDVLAWAARAAAVSAAGSCLGSLVAAVLGRRLTHRRWLRLARIGAPLACAGAVVCYLLLGQPGLYGDHLFVVLRAQADLAQAERVDDYGERRDAVYRALVAHADASQQRIRRVLDRAGVPYTPYYLANALEVHAGPLARLWLEAQPEVDRVLHAPVLRPLPAPAPAARGRAAPPTGPLWNLTAIGVDRVWDELGITGRGIVVGQSDSGVQWDHPELIGGYLGAEGDHDYHWLDPWNQTPAPTDNGGHGTHTLASAVGSSVGVAPGARWYACVNLDRNLANPPRYLDCLQFMLAPYPPQGDPFVSGDPRRGAHMINNSWGCPELEGCDPNALLAAARSLRAAGVFVVAGSGNEGDACGSVSAPLAIYDEVFTVGAVDATLRIASFSSRGPVWVDESGRTKPDLLAPGVEVLSAYPGGTYAYADGTSMATPHVVGVVALMWSANPSLVGRIDVTERILAESARPYDEDTHGVPRCAVSGAHPDNAVGYGIVDAYAAVQRAIAEGP
ncbi:MAG: S8 family serine peptidase [Anaerolineae bacterium]|nr:S8 family serine peptidase [Anaerolineae bacterium]